MSLTERMLQNNVMIPKILVKSTQNDKGLCRENKQIKHE